MSQDFSIQIYPKDNSSGFCVLPKTTIKNFPETIKIKIASGRETMFEISLIIRSKKSRFYNFDTGVIKVPYVTPSEYNGYDIVQYVFQNSKFTFAGYTRSKQPQSFSKTSSSFTVSVIR